MTRTRAERNLRLLVPHAASVGFLAWMPIFFLFFEERIGFSQALLLESIYYACVVAVEVPSGYVSDRFGRRGALLISSLTLTGAHLLFFVAQDFVLLVLAQALLATGLAFCSGTDASLHYESLVAAGRSDELAARESRLSAVRFFSGALAALVGGAVAVEGFRYAYLLSAAGSFVGVVAVLGMRDVREGDHGRSFLNVLAACARQTRSSRTLAWFALVSVAATVCNHLPYEFAQSALTSTEGDALPTKETALWLGLHVAVVSLVALPFARWSAALSRGRLRVHLVVSLTLTFLIVLSMRFAAAPWVVIIVAARSIPRALQDAPLRAAISPRIGSEERATYFSLLSLAGRASYALVLLAFATTAGDSLDATLTMALYVVAAAVLVVTLTASLATDADVGSRSRGRS